MKFFRKENFIKKTIITIVIVLLVNFSIPTMSRAADVSEAVADFLLKIPDGIMWLMQYTFLGEADVLIKTHSDEKKEGSMVGCIIAGGAIGGTAGAGIGSIIPVGGTLIVGIIGGTVGAIGGLITGFFTTDNGDYNLPNIKYTPYAIFSNKVPILNADFFGKVEDKKIYTYYSTNVGEIGANMINSFYSEKKEDVENYLKLELSRIANTPSKREKVINYMNNLLKLYLTNDPDTSSYTVAKNKLDLEVNSWISAGVFEVDNSLYNGSFSDYINTYKSELNSIRGETEIDEIIKGLEDELNMIGTTKPLIKFNWEMKFPPNSSLVTEGILTNQKELNEQINNIKEETVTDSVSVLKPIVSKWYNILRTIAIVGLLSVLVYIGIRILVYSTSAHDKAKYKTMLKDWLVGLCLLFVLHFIMSFTMTVTRYIRDIFDNSPMEDDKLIVQDDLECLENEPKNILAFQMHNSETGYWSVNMIEKIRQSITIHEESIDKKISYTIMYIVIIIEVLIFTFQYLKRVVTMAILTLIAPLVALTYPIDKITDGQAQGFNIWLKEYIFNALLQPLHLILYTIIMSAAFALVKTNPIYGIVALGCITPMEKLLRKIFGFGKAESVGTFGGVAGATVVMSTIGSLQKLRKKPPIGKGNEKGDKIKLWDNKKSLNAESMLLGAPELGTKSLANSNVSPSFNDNTNSQTTKKVKVKGKNLPRNTVTPGTTNKMRSYAMSKKKAKANVANTTPPTPIRNMPTTNRKPSMSKRTIRNPRLYALGQIGKSAGRKLTRDLTIGNVAKTVAKGVTGATVGGILGTVGLAAGITSGDLGKAVKYTTTAGVAGATLGSSFADRRADVLGNIKDTYETAYASVDEDYATDKRIKEFMKNDQNIQYLESRYPDKQEYDKVMNVMKEAAKYGITNPHDCAAIYEMKRKYGLSIEQGIATSKMCKRMGDVSDPEVQENYRKYLKRKGYSDNQIDILFDRVEYYDKERD